MNGEFLEIFSDQFSMDSYKQNKKKTNKTLEQHLKIFDLWLR